MRVTSVGAAAVLGAAQACAEVAVFLSRLGAAAEDRAHAVAALWDTLRSRLPASVTFSLTTAILAMVSPDGQLSIATAGHPPPLLREPDGAVRRIEYLGPMLGLPIDHSYAASTLTLRTGSMLLFYTDGLIERHNAIIDVGIDQLAAAFRVARGSADQVADVVCEVMLRDSSREDDTCLLVCELTSDRAGAGGGPPAPTRAEPLS